MTWMAMDREARIAAVRAGKEENLTAKKLAAIHKTGWHAIAAVARENGIALRDVTPEAMPADTDAGLATAGSVGPEPTSDGGRNEVDRENVSREERPASGEDRSSDDPEAASTAGRVYRVRLAADAADLLAAFAAATGRRPEELIASLATAVLFDDAAAHADREVEAA